MIFQRFYRILNQWSLAGQSERHRLIPATRALLLLLCCTVLTAVFTGCVPRRNLDIGGPTISSTRIPKPVPYRVYTPPGWDGNRPLPLVVFLHDSNGHCTDLETSKVIQFMHGLIAQKNMKPFIMAAPESEGYWWDYFSGTHKYTEFLMEDFIPAIQKEYAVAKGPRGLHVLGVGTGGQAAAELSFRYPGQIGSIGALGSYFFDTFGAAKFVGTQFFSGLKEILGPPDNYEAMASHNVFERIPDRKSVGRVRFVLGAGAFGDWNTTESNELFRQHLMRLNIPHDYVVYHGSSKWESRRNILPVFIGLQLGDRRNRGEVNGMPYEVMMYR